MVDGDSGDDASTAMSAGASKERYGTLKWFEQQYGRDPSDPWGLTWRPSQRLRYQRVLDAVQALDEPLPRIMDVGCATGEFTHLISRHVRSATQVLGVDFVSTAIERARRRFPDVRFTTESVFSLGARYQGQFDLVFCLEVLYYIEARERAAAIRSLHDAVREGGYVVFSSFVGPSPHFAPNEFLSLVATEFEVIRWELLHLRVISLIEKLGHRLRACMAGRGEARRARRQGRRIRTLPWFAAVAIEKWSRHLGPLTSSHTLVLARAKADREGGERGGTFG